MSINVMALGIALGVALLYFFTLFFFQFFFQGKLKNVVSASRALRIVSVIFLAGLVVVILSQLVPDGALGNRILHVFGGGFLATIACFFGAKDSGVSFSRFQLAALLFLLVTALGVGNELLEFLLQTVTSKIFAGSISDTWFDLLSNTVGIFFAWLVLLPFSSKKN